MSFKDLPADARPREKLLARGAAALSDTELLAILLRTGIAGRGVLALADDLLQMPGTTKAGDDGDAAGTAAGGFGGLAGLLQASAGIWRASRAWGRPSAPNCWR